MTTTDTLTCPVCGNDMPPLNSYGKPRKVCSSACSGAHSSKNRGNCRQNRVEDVEDLTAGGVPPAEIARRLGIKPGSVARAMERAGRHDLARLFQPLRDRERRHPCTECGEPGVCHTADRCVRCGDRARCEKRWAS